MCWFRIRWKRTENPLFFTFHIFFTDAPSGAQGQFAKFKRFFASLFTMSTTWAMSRWISRGYSLVWVNSLHVYQSLFLSFSRLSTLFARFSFSKTFSLVWIHSLHVCHLLDLFLSHAPVSYVHLLYILIYFSASMSRSLHFSCSRSLYHSLVFDFGTLPLVPSTTLSILIQSTVWWRAELSCLLQPSLPSLFLLMKPRWMYVYISCCEMFFFILHFTFSKSFCLCVCFQSVYESMQVSNPLISPTCPPLLPLFHWLKFPSRRDAVSPLPSYRYPLYYSQFVPSLYYSQYAWDDHYIRFSWKQSFTVHMCSDCAIANRRMCFDD